MPTCLSKPPLVQLMAFNSLDAIFGAYSAVAPLAHAPYRTAEAQLVRQAQLVRPALDLGCGSGEFMRLALRGLVDVGIDASLPRISRYRRPSAYHFHTFRRLQMR